MPDRPKGLFFAEFVFDGFFFFVELHEKVFYGDFAVGEFAGAEVIGGGIAEEFVFDVHQFFFQLGDLFGDGIQTALVLAETGGFGFALLVLFLLGKLEGYLFFL